VARPPRKRSGTSRSRLSSRKRRTPRLPPATAPSSSAVPPEPIYSVPAVPKAYGSALAPETPSWTEALPEMEHLSPEPKSNEPPVASAPIGTESRESPVPRTTFPITGGQTMASTFRFISGGGTRSTTEADSAAARSFLQNAAVPGTVTPPGTVHVPGIPPIQAPSRTPSAPAAPRVAPQPSPGVPRLSPSPTPTAPRVSPSRPPSTVPRAVPQLPPSTPAAPQHVPQLAPSAVPQFAPQAPVTTPVTPRSIPPATVPSAPTAPSVFPPFPVAPYPPMPAPQAPQAPSITPTTGPVAPGAVPQAPCPPGVVMPPCPPIPQPYPCPPGAPIAYAWPSTMAYPGSCCCATAIVGIVSTVATTATTAITAIAGIAAMGHKGG
jgi:hypothetical protein